MMANFLIGLREGLEAALVVGILVAYLIRTDRRDLLRWVWYGVALAVAISLGFGALLTYGPRGLSFEAQEALGGVLSILAVGLITWMIFWMARTARTLRGELQHKLDLAAAAGPTSVMVMAVLAVGREGLETALFLWAGAKAAGESTDPLLGAVLGLAVAIALGFAITKGAVRLDLGKFFTWTAVLLIFVAAGVLAYGIHDLQEAGVLPGLNSLAFDVSEQIPPSSWYGTLLKGTLNFSPATTWLELTVWLSYLAVVLPMFSRTVRRANDPGSSSSAMTAVPANRGAPV
ncbi:MAG: FTR1 family protein [Actinobacteria bacterium]|nr:FTR1 family protein [Actinomycetota bacterium]MCB9390874.1 FTR1 family protein [Acidimicrobiia bacterium]